MHFSYFPSFFLLFLFWDFRASIFFILCEYFMSSLQMLCCEQAEMLNLFPLQVWRTDGSKQGSSCTTNFLHLHQLGKRCPCAYYNLPRYWQQLVFDHHLKSTGVSDYTETLHYTLFSFSLWLLCFCEGGLAKSLLLLSCYADTQIHFGVNAEAFTTGLEHPERSRLKWK